jgi:hypothetical protein
MRWSPIFKQSLLIALSLSLIFAFVITAIAEPFSVKLAKCTVFLVSNQNCEPVRRDINGLAVVSYPEPIGVQRYAISIADVAMDDYQSYVSTGNDISRTRFLHASGWLVDHIDERGINRVTFDWRKYNLTAPWQSGMAQGLILRVLQHAYEITGEQRYSDAAQKVLHSFLIDVKDGGVTYTEEWWYEEYADDAGGSEPHVLNGMMYATLDLLDYYKRTKEPLAKDLFEKGVQSLKSNMWKYEAPDGSGYTYYDLHGNPAWEYQEVHVRLARELHNATGDPIFKEYADRWQEFREWSSFGLWILHPLNVKLLAIVVNAISCFIITFLATLIGRLFWRAVKRKLSAVNRIR